MAVGVLSGGVYECHGEFLLSAVCECRGAALVQEEATGEWDYWTELEREEMWTPWLVGVMKKLKILAGMEIMVIIV